MDKERPQLVGKSPAEKAAILQQEALATLDLALAADGSQRMLWLNAALELRRWAREYEQEGDAET